MKVQIRLALVGVMAAFTGNNCACPGFRSGHLQGQVRDVSRSGWFGKHSGWKNL